MGGSSGGNEKTTTTQNSAPWSEQTPFLRYGMNEATRLYQQQGPQYYPGSTVAPFSAEQNEAFASGAQRARQGNQSMQMAEGFGQDVMGGKYLNSDPYSDQVFQNIQQKVMPGVNSNFMGSGRYGSGLHADTMTRALTEAYAPYASQNYQMGLDRMGQAASMAPMFAANDYTDLAALESIGQQKQQLGQQELGDAASRWQYYQQLPYDKLGQYLNNIGGSYGGTVVGTTKTPSTQPSMFQQVAGAGMGLLGTVGSLGYLSDMRTKEDIRRVGAMDDGTPIYAYRYKGSPQTQFGVMAQEVAETHPDAVIMRPDGFLAVDYAKLADAVRC